MLNAASQMVASGGFVRVWINTAGCNDLCYGGGVVKKKKDEKIILHIYPFDVEVEFKEIIESNLYNGLSISEWAQLTNLSISSFKREFRKHYNSSPARYIKERKLKQAARLLTATNLRISEIAFDLGFSDLAHFSRSFQKEYQISPSDYRMNFSNKSLN